MAQRTDVSCILLQQLRTDAQRFRQYDFHGMLSFFLEMCSLSATYCTPDDKKAQIKKINFG
jgi:hypothetical protein